jgi:hypothetical protein
MTGSVLQEHGATDTVEVYCHILSQTVCDERGLVHMSSCFDDHSTLSYKIQQIKIREPAGN